MWYDIYIYVVRQLKVKLTGTNRLKVRIMSCPKVCRVRGPDHTRDCDDILSVVLRPTQYIVLEVSCFLTAGQK